jgi:hypothetical protein
MTYSPFSGRRQEPPKLELIEMLWRVVGPSGKTIVCGIYEGAAGRVEVRCHYAESFDSLIRSEVASDIDVARDMANAWRAAAIEKGFTDVH